MNHYQHLTPGKPARRYPERIIRVAVMAFNCYVTAEITWTVIKPGEPHLYEIAQEHGGKAYRRLRYRMEVLETLRMIRRLPENDA